MDVLLVMALLALPSGALGILVAVVLVGAVPRPWPAVAGAALASALVLVGVLLSYRDGVRADESGGEGDVFSQVGWLAAAVTLAAAAIVLQRAHLRRQSRRPRPAGEAGQPLLAQLPAPADQSVESADSTEPDPAGGRGEVAARSHPISQPGSQGRT